MRQNTTAAVEQPSWLMLLNSTVDLMNTEIELGLTFAERAKTSRNAETKARNVRNARKAYEVVARFLASKDFGNSLSSVMADRLSVLRQRLSDLGKEFGTKTAAANSA